MPLSFAPLSFAQSIRERVQYDPFPSPVPSSFHKTFDIRVPDFDQGLSLTSRI